MSSQQTGQTCEQDGERAAPLCGDPEKEEQLRKQLQLLDRMGRIGRKVMVLSGKGGVGKSTVAVNLAFVLAQAGKRVGLLDADIHGPSIPALLHLEGRTSAGASGDSLLPVMLENGIRVISMGLLIASRDDAIIWRGPIKYKVIEQFLRSVEWGDLDFLIVDSPPGTGDEPLSVVQLLEKVDGAIVVTTPQQVAISDVRKAITFCRKVHLPVLGVLENMSGFVCPHCRKRVDIFQTGGGKAMAKDMGVPFLGSIPLDPDIVRSGDAGTPYVQAFAESEAAKAFHKAIEPILKRLA